MSNIYDFGGQLSRIGDTLTQNRDLAQQQAMRDALGAAKLPDGTIDYNKAAQIAIQFGSPQTATALAGIENQRAQRGLQERTVRLQEEAAHEKPQVVWQEDDSGNKVPYLVQPYGRGVARVPITGDPGGGAPSNPYAYGKMNDEQAKSALYANRMFAAEKILSDPSVVAAATSSEQRARSALSEKIPFGLGRSIPSADYLKFDQAQRDFINATLRRESGAAINAGEFESAYKQYLPLPNDPPEVLRQKANARAEAIRGIAAGAGRSYVPPNTFDPQGNIAPNPAFDRRAQERRQQELAAQRPAAPGQPPPPQAPPPPQPQQSSQPNARQIELLRANPALAQQFDAKFGRGTSALILQQQQQPQGPQ